MHTNATSYLVAVSHDNVGYLPVFLLMFMCEYVLTMVAILLRGRYLPRKSLREVHFENGVFSQVIYDFIVV